MDDFTLSGGVNPAPWVIYRNSITSVVTGNDDSSLKDTQYYPYDMVHWR